VLCTLFFVLQRIVLKSTEHKYSVQKTVLLSVIMISYLGNLWEGDLDDVAIRTFHFDTWSGQCLRSFQTVNGSAHSLSVCSENLDVWLTVKRLKCRQGFRHFQDFILSCQFQLTTC